MRGAMPEDWGCMTFTLSDQKCSVTITMHVNDKKEPVYGLRASVNTADIRDMTSKRPSRSACYYLRSCKDAGGRDRQAVPENPM